MKKPENDITSEKLRTQIKQIHKEATATKKKNKLDENKMAEITASMLSQAQFDEEERKMFQDVAVHVLKRTSQHWYCLLYTSKGIAVRQALTNALQQSQENERMHGHAYSTYTNIVYKAVFGKDAKHLREEYGISKKENLRDYFSEEELKAVQSVEMIVSGLVNCGWGYDQIKEFVMNQNLKMLAAWYVDKSGKMCYTDSSGALK